VIGEFIRCYLEEEKTVLDHLDVNAFEAIVELFQEAYEQGRRIFVFGNGGSGATASHLACDINKGASYGLTKRFRVMCLNDNVPTVVAYANDVAFADAFVEQLKNFMEPGDLVVGISGSGNSENVLRAIQYANERGGRSVGLTGFDGGGLARAAGVSLVVPSFDMQKVEDVHLILAHVMMQVFRRRLHGTER